MQAKLPVTAWRKSIPGGQHGGYKGTVVGIGSLHWGSPKKAMGLERDEDEE